MSFVLVGHGPRYAKMSWITEGNSMALACDFFTLAIVRYGSLSEVGSRDHIPLPPRKCVGRASLRLVCGQVAEPVGPCPWMGGLPTHLPMIEAHTRRWLETANTGHSIILSSRTRIDCGTVSTRTNIAERASLMFKAIDQVFVAVSRPCARKIRSWTLPIRPNL